MGEKPTKKQQHPTFEVRVGCLPSPFEVPLLGVPPAPNPDQRNIDRDGPPSAWSKDLGQEIHHKPNHHSSKDLGSDGHLCVVWALVQTMGHPPQHQGPQNTKEQGVADAAVEGEVVELAQEILAQDVHVREGASHGAPHHGSAANATSQDRFSHRRPQHDLRQRIHVSKVVVERVCTCLFCWENHEFCPGVLQQCTLRQIAHHEKDFERLRVGCLVAQPLVVDAFLGMFPRFDLNRIRWRAERR